MEQLSLFSNTEYKTLRTTKPVMDAESLKQWKLRVFNYQQNIRSSEPPQQVTLFDVALTHCNPDTIDPFKLQLQSMAFYRMPDDYGQAALYFIIDSASEILLYVGETKHSNKRLCTGQKIEKKLAKETKKGFHRKLPHNQRNPYEPD